MERLTEEIPLWLEESWTSAEEPSTEKIDDVYLRLREYENTRLMPEEIAHWKNCVETSTLKHVFEVAERIEAERDALKAELTDLRRKKEAGLIVELPCKRGERAYQIYEEWEDNKGCIANCLDGFGVSCNCAYWDKVKEACTNIPGKRGIRSIRFDYEHIRKFNKTVFLTREAAEAALQEKINE